MPKAILSNDKGLVQSSGNGLRLTPVNSNGGGLHFKTIEVDLGGTAIASATNNRFVADTGISLPAQSIVLGCSVVVTELSDQANLSLSVALDDDASTLSQGDSVSGSELFAGPAELGNGETVNKGFGTFLTTGVAIGANVDVVLINGDGSNTVATHASGKAVVTVAYSGVES